MVKFWFFTEHSYDIDRIIKSCQRRGKNYVALVKTKSLVLAWYSIQTEENSIRTFILIYN